VLARAGANGFAVLRQAPAWIFIIVARIGASDVIVAAAVPGYTLQIDDFDLAPLDRLARCGCRHVALACWRCLSWLGRLLLAGTVKIEAANNP
jgi:hypothetical protein